LQRFGASSGKLTFLWRTSMTTYLYPAYFHGDEGGRYGIEFPDLPGCFSACEEDAHHSELAE